MKIFQNTFICSILIVGLIISTGCKKERNKLTVSPNTIEFDSLGGFTSLSLETDADSWSITNDASDWLILSNNSGTQHTAIVTIGVETITVEPRNTTLIIKAGDATPVEVPVSQKTSTYLYSLLASPTTLGFERAGNELNLIISTNAPQWSISGDVDWLTFSSSEGSGSSSLKVTAQENEVEDARTAIVTVSAEYAPDVQIPVTQNGQLYPSYNTDPIPPDASGMSSLATEIADNIVIGWNIGNSLESIGGETAWGNPMISASLIHLVKESGFNAVRIPCSFNQYMEDASTAKLKTEWLDRVKQVVQYCVDEDLYAILNIHWDGGWLENNCTPAKKEANNAKQKAFWEQIATHLRDFDEHLLFASANEPNVGNETQMAVLLSYHQTFIDAVRSTGGRNAYRTLVIQGPNTDIELTNQLMTTLPVDQIPNRMMVEIHYYSPWNFCGLTEDASWGKMFYYWGEDYHSTTDPDRNPTWGEEDFVDAMMTLMHNQFVQQGIPVVLGEYSAVRRSNLTGDALELHLAARAFFYYYVTKTAKENGLITFYWDNGYTGTNGCALFNRNSNTVFDQQALDALIDGANQ